MASVQVVNFKNEKVGTVDLDAEVFGVEVKQDVLQTVVKWQLACRRQGTHMVKTRAFVRGGGKKPFKQKGTGNARQGSSRSPLMPGGAKLFGPAPRDYSYALPKKVRALGLKMALSYLSNEGRLTVVDGIESKSGKTKDLSQSLSKGLGLKKAMIVDAQINDMVKRASSNMKAYRYGGVESLNVFDLLKYNHLILNKSAVEAVVRKVKAGEAK